MGRDPLVPPVERPGDPDTDTRVFKHKNLLIWSEAHRGELIWAALTLVRAGLARGQAPDKALGSFEAWSRVMGTILDGVGVPGFLGNLTAFYEKANEDRAPWEQVVTAWHAAFSTRVQTSGEVYKGVVQNTDDINLPLTGNTERALQTSFGAQLKTQQDRVIAGFRIRQVGKRDGALTWRLEPYNPTKAEPTEPTEPLSTQSEKTPNVSPLYALPDSTAETGSGGSGGSVPRRALTMAAMLTEQ